MRWRIPKYFPGWFVSGGGGSGGSGTVQTDGVTIQGDGSAGNKIAIKQVETNTGLTGAGTLASPLAIAPITYWPIGTFGGGPFQAVTANTLVLGGFILPIAVTFANLTFYVQTADNANNNDVGIYNAAGTLLANIGAQHIAAAVQRTIATVQGSQTIQPGKYLFAWTSAASTLALYTDQAVNTAFIWFTSASYGVSAGGALPASITAPTQSPTFGGIQPWAALS